MLKLVSFHIQAHLNAFLQILEYFSQICLGPLATESPCIKTELRPSEDVIYIVRNLLLDIVFMLVKEYTRTNAALQGFRVVLWLLLG